MAGRLHGGTSRQGRGVRSRPSSHTYRSYVVPTECSIVYVGVKYVESPLSDHSRCSSVPVGVADLPPVELDVVARGLSLFGLPAVVNVTPDRAATEPVTPDL